ncbi:MAG: methyl-accepting chemotaxis protein [Oleiphilaceae bacterium]|nr:methyl-accepting chemotaxis protein [Oleiphilaceae bacterium]
MHGNTSIKFWIDKPRHASKQKQGLADASSTSAIKRVADNLITLLDFFPLMDDPMFKNSNSPAQTRHADFQMLIVLLGHIPVVGLIVPMGYGTMVFALVASLMVGGLAVASFLTLRGTRACGIVFAACLMLFSAIMIQAQLGRIEMHFHIFSALALTIVYRDAFVILAAAVTIALHHYVVTALQLSDASLFGTQIIIYNHDAGWSTMIAHALFVVFEAGILVYFAVKMAEERRRANTMIELIDAFEKSGHLDRRLESTDSASMAFNSLLNGFEGLIVEFRNVAKALSDDADKLSGLSTHTKTLTEDQNAESQQAASATEEMSATIQEVAQNAQLAAQSATDAVSGANEGDDLTRQAFERTKKANQMLGESVEKVGNLAHQIEAINTFITSINELSDQTNLLALNAAIEAARAGEHGRGFSVVADEVRNLSHRTQSFTTQIRDTIQALITNAEATQSTITLSQSISGEATDLLEKTSASIVRIHESVQSLQSMNDQTAAAAEQQAVASGHINKSIQSVAEKSDQVLQGTQSTADISNHLSEIVNKTNNMIDTYTISTR